MGYFTRQRTPETPELDQNSSASRSTGDCEEPQPRTPQGDLPEPCVNPAELFLNTFGGHEPGEGEQYGGRQKSRDPNEGIENPEDFDANYSTAHLGPEAAQFQTATPTGSGSLDQFRDDLFNFETLRLQSNEAGPYVPLDALSHNTMTLQHQAQCQGGNVCLRCGGNPNEFENFGRPLSQESSMDSDSDRQSHELPPSTPSAEGSLLPQKRRLEPTAQSHHVPRKIPQVHCNWCDKPLMRSNDLLRHQQTACRNRPQDVQTTRFQCQFPGCKFSHPRKDKLLIHCRREKHGEEAVLPSP